MFSQARESRSVDRTKICAYFIAINLFKFWKLIDLQSILIFSNLNHFHFIFGVAWRSKTKLFPSSFNLMAARCDAKTHFNNCDKAPLTIPNVMVHEFKPHAKLSETLIFSQQTNKTEKTISLKTF